MKTNLIKTIKSNAPLILTIAGSVGIVGTVILTGKATMKCHDILEADISVKEKIVKAAPKYIPTAISACATVSCFWGAHVLSKQQQASLVSAYTLLNNYHHQYRNKVIDICGEEVDRDVRNAIIHDNAEVHINNVNYPDKKRWFRDSVTGEEVYMYEREVIDAEYHLNRNFMLSGCASVGDWCDFLGILQPKDAEERGWCICDGYSWIDFEHRLNPETGVIDIIAIFPPDEGYLEDWR